MTRSRLFYLALGVSLVGSPLFSGCDASKSNDKLREVADIEAQQQVNAERQYLESKAKAMEADLEKRQRFYQALAGTYEGMMRVGQGDFKIRLTLAPSLPRYVPRDRVRTVEEVTSDLTNLYFNVQVVQWNPQTSFGSVGCLVSNVRPDIIRGRVNVASEDCKNLYNFEITDGGSEVPDTHAASRLAEAITDGKLESVAQVSGKMQPTTNANVYTFTATRVQE